MLALLSILFVLLTSCEDLFSEGKNEYYNPDYKENQLKKALNISYMTFGSYETNYSLHGGIDLFDDNGNLYVASLSKVLDVDQGGHRYHLTYGFKDKKSNKFDYKILINKLDGFYKANYEGEKNFIRILKVEKIIHIFYLDNNKNLIHLNSSNNFTAQTLQTAVAAFDVKLHDGNISIATLVGYKYSETFIYYSKLNSPKQLVKHLPDYRYYSSSLNLSFVGQIPVISTKLYSYTDRTSDFLVFHFKDQWKQIQVARGVSNEEQFNQYIIENKLYSCYHDIAQMWHRVSIEFIAEGEDIVELPIGIGRSDISCSVNKNQKFSFFYYNNAWGGVYTYQFFHDGLDDFYEVKLPFRFSIYKVKSMTDNSWLLGHSSDLKRMVIFKMN